MSTVETREDNVVHSIDLLKIRPNMVVRKSQLMVQMQVISIRSHTGDCYYQNAKPHLDPSTSGYDLAVPSLHL